MSNFLGALPALLGVVIGIAATSLADNARWKRRQAIRWDERRVDAYAEYAKSVKRIHVIALMIIRPERAYYGAKPIDRESALEMLTQADAQRTEAWELMLLLSDQATAHAALQWHNAVRCEAEFVRSRPDVAKSDDWKALVRSADQARDHFYEAARSSVNVGGGSVAVAKLMPTAAPARTDSKQPADL